MKSPLVRLVLTDGVLAGTLSAAVLAWRGRRDAGSAAAPVNAVSHWIWPRAALQRDDVTARHTATGVVIHMASAAMWACIYAVWRARRPRPTPVNALTDAAVLTAVAATVDLAVVPDRLTPGFEHRLAPRSLVAVYGGFALGLALGGLLAMRR
jgi:hypothetical protein